MTSRAMNQSQQIDLLAGMDRLEHWRLEDPEYRSVQIVRYGPGDEQAWQVSAHDSRVDATVTNDASLLRAARIQTGAHEGGVPVE